MCVLFGIHLESTAETNVLQPETSSICMFFAAAEQQQVLTPKIWPFLTRRQAKVWFGENAQANYSREYIPNSAGEKISAGASAEKDQFHACTSNPDAKTVHEVFWTAI